MKKNLLSIRIKASLLIGGMLLCAASYAATFTASASGNWTSSATWAGGTAPSLSITGDQVIIPSGITVTLSNNLSINGSLAALAVNGTLTSAASDTLSTGLGAVTGAGTLSVSNLVLGAGSALAFTGTVTANTVTNWSVGLQAAANFTVSQSLTLAAGSLNVATNGLFTMAGNSNIIVTGGTMAVSGGTLTLTNTYNVTYLTAPALAGVELTGSGLNNLTVNVPGGDSVGLSTNANVNGTLTLTGGTLSINGHTLTLSGSIAGSGGGTVSSTGTSNLTVDVASSSTGSLTFASSGNTVNNFTLNITGSGGSLALGSNLTVNGTLTLTNGTLNIGSNQLDIGASGSVSGGSASSYVIASGSGSLGMQLTAGSSGWTTFQVGTSTSYAPVGVQLNSGSTSGMVNVSAVAGVWSTGTSGTDLSLTQPMVNVSWLVEPVNTNNVSANIEAMWSAATQVNGFNFDSAYISHYISGAWDVSNVGSATLNGSLYAIVRSNITSFSPFAVFGNRAATAVQEVGSDAFSFAVYPNPAGDHILVKNVNAGSSRFNMEVMDMNGNIISQQILTDYSTELSLKGLSTGTYAIRLFNDKTNVVKRFTKL